MESFLAVFLGFLVDYVFFFVQEIYLYGHPKKPPDLIVA